MKKLIYISLLFLIVVACESVPSDILSKGEMRDILYDIHLSQNINMFDDNYDDKAVREITLRQSVLNKYGITQAQFDSSLVYYCRHADQLYDIYLDLSERLRQDVIDAGGDVDMNMLAGADTSDIWKAERSLALMQHPPYNVRKFTIEADSTVLPGDRFTLSYTPQFIFQDGMRDVVCVFSVTLKNDSVLNEVRHSNSSDMITTMTLDDRERIGVKNVRLYFMCPMNISEAYSSTLRLTFVNNIRLIHTHTEGEVKKVEKPQKDTIATKEETIEPVQEEATQLPAGESRHVRVRSLQEKPVMLETKRVR